MKAEGRNREALTVNSWRSPCLLLGARFSLSCHVFAIACRAFAAARRAFATAPRAAISFVVPVALVATLASLALMLSIGPAAIAATAGGPEACGVLTEDSLQAGLTAGSGISLSSGSEESTGIDFGEVRPSLSPYIVPMAFQITCTSRENPIQVTIKGEDLRQVDPTGNREEPSGDAKTIPCARIGWRVSGDSPWSQLAASPAPLLLVPIGERRNICLDFKYEVLWEDPVGRYSCPVTVSFSPQAERVLSKAVPNPFSPNGDGIRDETLIACNLPWESDKPETIECIVDLPDALNLQAVRRFEIPDVQSPTTVWVTWDGTDEGGCAVPDGCYRYKFMKSGESEEFGSGIVITDTIPPGLRVYSPKDGWEVASDTIVTGQTESEECLVSAFIQDRLACQARPSGDGSFSLRVFAPPGISRLSIESEDLAGNRSLHHMNVVNNTAVTISGPSYREAKSQVAKVRGRAPVSARVTLAVNGNEAGEAKSTEQGDWRVDGVRLAPGCNILTASAVNERGEVVKSKDPVIVRYVQYEGVGRISGRVTDAYTGEPIKGAEVSLIAEEGGVISAKGTRETGEYEFSEAHPGTYRLRAVCLNYFTQEICGIELGVEDEAVIDFELIPNSALSLKKQVNVDACSIGDIVEYTLSVENLTDMDVNNVKVYDLLPYGIAVIPGTSTVRGEHSEPDMEMNGKRREPDGSDQAVWGIGTLGPHETAAVTFKAVVGFQHGAWGTTCNRAGNMTNKAYATGETGFGQVETAPSEATLFVSKGVFSNDGLVIGKVFLDMDGDGKMGPGEHALRGAVILTEDGTRVSTDSSGMYTIKGIRPGFHVILLCSDSLPGGFQSNRRNIVVDVRPHSIVRLDFPVTPRKSTVSELEGKEDLQGEDELQRKDNLQSSDNDAVNNNTCSDTGDNEAGNTRNNNARGAASATYGEESVVIAVVGEATASSAVFSGNSKKARETEEMGSLSDIAVDGNLAFFLSGSVQGRYLITCGFDLAGRAQEKPGYQDQVALHLGCGDASEVGGSLPYAGPLYFGLKWDNWEASFCTFRTDFIRSELAPYEKALPGAIVRYDKDNVKAAVFDSASGLAAGHVQGGAIEAWVSPKLRLGGAIVKHIESPATGYLGNVHSEYLITQDLRVYTELAAACGHLGEVSDSLRDSGALSLRCVGEVGPVFLEARYKAIGPRFSNPPRRVKTDIADLGLNVRLSPIQDLLPELSLYGEAEVTRSNLSMSKEGPPTCDTSYTLGTSYALGDTGVIVMDVKHKMAIAESGGEAAAGSALMMTDKSFGIKTKGSVTKAVHGSVGVRWGRRTDLAKNAQEVGYSQIEAEAKGMIARDLSLVFKCEATFPSQDAVPAIRAGIARTRLAIGAGWTVSPNFESHAEVSSSPSGGTVLALHMTCKASPYLEAALRYEAATEAGKSEVSLKADYNSGQGLGLTVNYDKQVGKDNRTCLGHELGFTWRPVFQDKVVAFGGVKGRQTTTATHTEFSRILTGHVGLAIAIDPLTDMSTRYVCKAVSEGNRVAGGSLDDLHAECKLATLRITRRLDMSKYKTDSRHKSAGEEIGENKQESNKGYGSDGKPKTAEEHRVDVTCESSLYFVDVGRQRKTESAIEAGIAISENVRLALGYRWTEFRHGAMSEAHRAGGRVYVRLGVGWATGI